MNKEIYLNLHINNCDCKLNTNNQEIIFEIIKNYFMNNYNIICKKYENEQKFLSYCITAQKHNNKIIISYYLDVRPGFEQIFEKKIYGNFINDKFIQDYSIVPEDINSIIQLNSLSVIKEYIYYNTNTKEYNINKEKLFNHLSIKDEYLGAHFWKEIINTMIGKGLYFSATIYGGLQLEENDIDTMTNIFNYILNPINKSKFNISSKYYSITISHMIYIHYKNINKQEYKFKETYKIYDIFKKIYNDTNIFTNIKNIIEEITYANYLYFNNDDSGLLNLYVKYNGTYNLLSFKESIKEYKKIYDTIKENEKIIPGKNYVYFDKIDFLLKRLNIITDNNYIKQIYKYINYDHSYENTIIKNKFFRQVINKLSFLEDYDNISIIHGYKDIFYEIIKNMVNELDIKKTIGSINYFKYQWNFMIDKCLELKIIKNYEHKTLTFI